MNKAKRAFRLIINKYLIAITVFALFMLFFDENNIFIQWQRKQELRELKANRNYYEERIKSTQEELSHLQTSPASIEKFVRENFLMKRDNEDIFIIDEPASATEKVKK